MKLIPNSNWTKNSLFLGMMDQAGVGVTYSFKNTRTMMAGLDSVQESQEMSEGGSAFYGILRASELVPYDSAIFISTDKIPNDASLMKNAATVLLKKRIRVIFHTHTNQISIPWRLNNGQDIFKKLFFLRTISALLDLVWRRDAQRGCRIDRWCSWCGSLTVWRWNFPNNRRAAAEWWSGPGNNFTINHLVWIGNVCIIALLSQTH